MFRMWFSTQGLSTSPSCQGVNGQEISGFSGGRNQLVAEEFLTGGFEDSR